MVRLCIRCAYGFSVSSHISWYGKRKNINRRQEKEENLCPHASAHKSTEIMLYLNHNAATEPHIHNPQHMIMRF